MPDRFPGISTLADIASFGQCSRNLKNLRYDGRYTPPSLQGSLAYPSTAGGVEWGGGAVDPRSGIYVVNSSYVAQIYKLLDRKDYEEQDQERHAGRLLPADRRALWFLPAQFRQFPRHALLESSLRHAVGLRSQQRQAAVEEAVRRGPEMGLLHAEILGFGDDRRAADHQSPASSSLVPRWTRGYGRSI